jgi:hypothetical protein
MSVFVCAIFEGILIPEISRLSYYKIEVIFKTVPQSNIIASIVVNFG